jgi:hypothetical protein
MGCIIKDLSEIIQSLISSVAIPRSGNTAMTAYTQHPGNNPAQRSHVALERRINTCDRRKNGDRRSLEERRLDSRLAAPRQPKTLRVWLRSLIRTRLGVDRRKKNNRRGITDRRRITIRTILTQDEINDLLAP